MAVAADAVAARAALARTPRRGGRRRILQRQSRPASRPRNAQPRRPLGLAAADPRRRADGRRAWPGRNSATAAPTVQASGIDIMLALDVSGSMQALDFKVDGQPHNRIDVVKSVVANSSKTGPTTALALSRLPALPYLVSPLTLDHDWLAAKSQPRPRRPVSKTARPSARPLPPVSTACATRPPNRRSSCCSPTA